MTAAPFQAQPADAPGPASRARTVQAAAQPVHPWPRTDRPLSIAIIGWARLSSQQREGSGYNLSKSELARGLALSGHRVSYLASGMTFRLSGPRCGRPHIVHRETWGGVPCYELRNSRNVSPAAWNFGNTRAEIREPEGTALVLRWLDDVQARIVHVHSQEGYGLDLIPAIEASGRPVVVTPHNYWFLCPQVDLLRHEREVCTDYDGGRRCEGCLPAVDAQRLRNQRAWGQTLEHALGLYWADVVRKAAYGVKPFVRAVARGQLLARYQPEPLHPDALGDPELALGFETVERDARADTIIDHKLPLAEHERPKDYARAEWGTNERLLDNRPAHRISLNIYGQRRDAGVAALAAASLVTPPSDYLRRVHIAMGVPEDKTRWVRLGQPHFDQINRRVRRSPGYERSPWDASRSERPLRFGFLGTTRPNKGLEVLARAIPLLDKHVRQRCQFLIRAQGGDFGFRKRLSRYPEVSVWGGYDLLQLISAVDEYDVGLLTHIWLENSPLVLLENFHAGKMVVCSRLGGPVDWVKDPAQHPDSYNGLLFPGGDEEALAACITRLATGQVEIPSPREIHRRVVLRSYPDHVREFESIYHDLLTARAAGAGQPKAAAASRATG
jgi:glycosyltransferase involved in cell wall biosynthesis